MTTMSCQVVAIMSSSSNPSTDRKEEEEFSNKIATMFVDFQKSIMLELKQFEEHMSEKYKQERKYQINMPSIEVDTDNQKKQQQQQILYPSVYHVN